GQRLQVGDVDVVGVSVLVRVGEGAVGVAKQRGQSLQPLENRSHVQLGGVAGLVNVVDVHAVRVHRDRGQRLQVGDVDVVGVSVLVRVGEGAVGVTNQRGQRLQLQIGRAPGRVGGAAAVGDAVDATADWV